MKKPVCVALVFLAVLSLTLIPFGHSIATELNQSVISINADGTFQPSNAPLTRSGDLYTLTGNFSGGIEVHRSNMTIDGAGYALNVCHGHPNPPRCVPT